jgi:hypothetical protein
MGFAASVNSDVSWPESDLEFADLCDFLGDADLLLPIATTPPMPLIAANDNQPIAGMERLEVCPQPAWTPAYMRVD